MNNGPNNQQPKPVNIKRDRGVSPLWILPVLALILAGWLVFKAVNEAGERIKIHFNDAAGLVAGRTTIRYQGLEVGIVRDVNLSNDLKSIYVEADIYPEAVQILRSGTRFWLVKPKASITGISGLDALVSGNYIALQPGEGKFTNEFDALDGQPADTPVGEGLKIQLRAPNLGSINIGSQVLYKKIPVGEVYNHSLSQNNKQVIIDVLIKPQYADLVTNKSRFWNISGMSANIGFNGVDVQFESLSAMISGAIAFDSPDKGLPIEPDHLFRLYPDLNTAGRGIAITIDLPENSNISASGAPIVYRSLEIGQISDIRLDQERGTIVAHAAIEPMMSDLLTTGSKMLLEEAELSLNGVKNIGNLLRGNFLTLIPGPGETSRQFIAINQDELQEQQPGVASFALYADDSYGIKRGTKLKHRGLEVGRVKSVKLDGNTVRFDVIVRPEYTRLIRSGSRFYLDGGIQANLSSKGLDVSVPPADQLISQSISFTSSGGSKVLKQYPLYKSRQLATLAAEKAHGFTTVELFADELPPVDKGSPVLYRNMAVGEVNSYELSRDGVSIKIKVDNKYRHLITADTVFWNRSGVEIQAGLDGVSVKADPISTLIKGGIAFDEIQGVSNRLGNRYKLYDSYLEAKNFGLVVTMIAEDAKTIKVTTPIRYQGVSVGKVIETEPDFDTGKVIVKARLFPKYAEILAKTDSHFWIVTPQISITGAKDLDTLLSSYIAVTPGKGTYSQSFTLGSTRQVNSGLTVILETEQRNSVTEGTPLLYRDIQVGEVVKVSLGELADRVIIEAQVEQNFSHLVRSDSVFWNVSGIDVTIGLTGASVQSGTMDSLIRGGIAFATPEAQPLSPVAKSYSHFLLHDSAQSEWKTWRTAIPKH
ncbi:MlaD family protein [Photobacterium lutimaris]|uniref:Paraquat-inducible protein B n=1 Tax=Photobacterium lutimaris TaxID=388278 RepID=A0A2T3J0L5_9GAMM|nr:MlaD family protein [Photobacterium lutimaris]PSU34634.1 paraquat-inducible protein B [Photobacterium lutimaris]TDR71521.1 paraquat-inducible protein B [Photobacterium lutimaris]